MGQNGMCLRARAADLDGLLGGGPSVVVFETSDCEPCRQLRSHLEAQAAEQPRLRIIRVGDADEGWVAARHHLTFVPTLVFHDGVGEIARFRGDPGREGLRAWVRFLLGEGPQPQVFEGPRHTLTASFGCCGQRLQKSDVPVLPVATVAKVTGAGRSSRSTQIGK